LEALPLDVRVGHLLETARLSSPPCSCHGLPEGLCPGPSPAPPPDLRSLIEHTLLRPEATPAAIERLCDEAREWRVRGVCVNPVHVEAAVKALSGSALEVITVCGFPLGASGRRAKAGEARSAAAAGAREVDMVAAIGHLKAHEDSTVAGEIAAVAEACHEAGARTKVILETALLEPPDVVRGCLLSWDAGADLVKTSTGFGPGGATAFHVALMRHAVGGALGVKAAGGIRDLGQALALVAAGATRLGTSASGTILAEADQRERGSRAM
jgi:deoxyribose-phosphate aldolase